MRTLDEAAGALGGSWAAAGTAEAGRWAERRPGLVAACTGMPVAALNGVWTTGAAPGVEAARDLLDRLDGAGVPYCLEHRPDAPPALSELAESRGMTVAARLPLMVADEAAGVRSPSAELAIRPLEPGELDAHVAIAAPAFGLPEDLFRRFMRPAVGMPGGECYVGSVDGADVVTGFALRQDDWVGVFNVATVPERRRRGHGAELTARMVGDAAAAGARSAWLQSSPSGYGVYERLGFRDLGAWTRYVSG